MNNFLISLCIEYHFMATNQQEIRQVMPHPDQFVSVFARNCDIRRITKPVAAAFLEQFHSYGPAACRYCYGLFVRRRTGAKEGIFTEGEMVAVATFSASRKWLKGDKVIRSYEWVRYASRSDVRVIGGMGKILKTFIQEHHPDDVMTYAISEVSEGDVYRKLGFVEEGIKTFRTSNSSSSDTSSSIKFRLKLTDY